MKKKLMALLLCSVTAVMLAACGSSNEGSTSEEKIYLEDSQIQQLFTDPEQFKGKYAKMSGVLLANPETDSDGSTALQIFYDTQNYDQNFIVYTDNADASLKSGDYVKVDGKVRGKFTGQNAMGAEISIPAIENASVTKSTYMDVVAPTTAALEPNVSSEQHGITASVDKVEYSDLETRVYMTVKNDSSDNVSLDVYGIKLIMDGQQIAQDNNSVSSFNGNYAELNYDITAGASSSGILVFPAIEQKKDFQVVLSNVISDDYELDFDTYTLNISAQ